MGLYSNCPCRNCVPPKRHPLCHSSCPDKKAWDEQTQDAKKQINYEKAKDFLSTGVLVDSQTKMLKRQNKNRWR